MDKHVLVTSENLKSMFLRTVVRAAAIAFPISYLVILWTGPFYLTPDSYGYLQVAGDLPLYWFHDANTSWSASIRTPVFPILLAAAWWFIGESIAAIKFLHSVLAFAVLGLIITLFHRDRDRCARAAAIWGGALLWTMVFSSSLLTEFSALVFLTSCFLTALAAVERTNLFWLLLAGVFANLSLLCRPMLVGVLLIPLASALSSTRVRQALLVALLPCLLTLGWMVWNVYRLESFTISVGSGIHRLASASLASDAPCKSLNLGILPAPSFTERRQISSSFEKAINHNIIQIINQCQKLGLTFSECDNRSRICANHAIFNELKPWLISTGLEFFAQFREPETYFLVYLLTIFCLRLPRGVAAVTLAAATTHVLYMLIAATHINFLIRFFNLTVVFSIIACLFALTKATLPSSNSK